MLPCPSTTREVVVVADLDEHVLNRAGGEVGDDAVDRVPHPAIMIPVWPVGTNAASIPRSRAAATISSEAVIFPTEQSVPTVSTTSASTSPEAPVATV